MNWVGSTSRRVRHAVWHAADRRGQTGDGFVAKAGTVRQLVVREVGDRGAQTAEAGLIDVGIVARVIGLARVGVHSTFNAARRRSCAEISLSLLGPSAGISISTQSTSPLNSRAE